MGGEALWELVKVFLAALLASTLTHLLTHRRFIQGRWWDRKADAYGSIIGSLVSMERSLESWLELLLMIQRMIQRGEEVPEDLARGGHEIGREFGKARDRIARAAIEGDYIISGKVSDALGELLMKLPPRRELPDDFESSKIVVLLGDWLGALNSCLKVVRAEARSDLRVK